MEKDHKKMFIGIIVFLLFSVMELTGYIVLDKKMKPKKVEPTNNIESKEELSDKDIQNLLDELISNDKEIGLYADSKISSEEASKEFISFNIYNYIQENNIDVVPGAELSDGLKISKENINKYINDKYNTNIKYDLPVSKDQFDAIGEIGCMSIYSFDENNWSVMTLGKTCGKNNISHKLIKYEEDGENLYIYTYLVDCYTELQFTTCNKEPNINSENPIFVCSAEDENNENCPSDLNYSNNKELEEYAKYTLENLTNSLNTYKHTFKKVDDKYYWQSSELQTN